MFVAVLGSIDRLRYRISLYDSVHPDFGLWTPYVEEEGELTCSHRRCGWYNLASVAIGAAGRESIEGDEGIPWERHPWRQVRSLSELPGTRR